MSKGDHLGEFELFVLAAVARLGDGAYGVTIRRDIEQRSGRLTSFGAVYATLQRLADKGYVTLTVSPPDPVPGGRSRKHARLTGSGERAMRDSLRALDRMVDGLRLRPGGQA